MSEVSADDMTEFAPYIKEYAQLFDADAENLLFFRRSDIISSSRRTRRLGMLCLYLLRLDFCFSFSEKLCSKAGKLEMRDGELPIGATRSAVRNNTQNELQDTVPVAPAR